MRTLPCPHPHPHHRWPGRRATTTSTAAVDCAVSFPCPTPCPPAHARTAPSSMGRASVRPRPREVCPAPKAPRLSRCPRRRGRRRIRRILEGKNLSTRAIRVHRTRSPCASTSRPYRAGRKGKNSRHGVTKQFGVGTMRKRCVYTHSRHINATLLVAFLPPPHTTFQRFPGLIPLLCSRPKKTWTLHACARMAIVPSISHLDSADQSVLRLASSTPSVSGKTRLRAHVGGSGCAAGCTRSTTTPIHTTGTAMPQAAVICAAGKFYAFGHDSTSSFPPITPCLPRPPLPTAPSPAHLSDSIHHPVDSTSRGTNRRRLAQGFRVGAVRAAPHRHTSSWCEPTFTL
ncbi:hypothetical protein K438DRAFT_416000 [Mycena galopus ATCC 62051]|nr:hypothetical protein K438DRAFT_416000 [Mycena galopus ATCC 62051]